MSTKFTKDGATKLVDNDAVKKLLLADGWKEDKPKAKKTAKKED